MESTPLVSIIIPSFNQGVFLSDTITSVVGQSYPRKEILVIDGGSTDGTGEVIQKHASDITYWVSERDNGQSHAFNKGLAKASGEVIGWLNSDDLYLGECIRDAVDFFKSHEDYAVVFADYIFVDRDSKFLKRRKEIPFSLSTYLWTDDCYHANCAGFFRRDVFDKIGGLDESLHFGMDYELYLRIARAGFKIGHRRAYWGAYRLHDMSKSVRSSDHQGREAHEIADRYISASLGKSTRKILKWWWSSSRIIRKLLLGSYLPVTPRDRMRHGK